MKALTFLGNGGSFASSHTSAYFTSGKDIVFIDMSMLNVKKAMLLHPETYDNMYIFITHMHDDHVSGLGSFIFRLYYIYNKRPIVVVPENIFDDVLDFCRITGVSTKLFKIEMAEEYKTDFFNGEAVKVSHVQELRDKTFGYVFYVDGKKIVYSGDAARLDEFEFALRGCDEFYCEASSNPNVKAHLYLPDAMDRLLGYASKGTKIYLMHVDDYDTIFGMTKDTPIRVIRVE